MGCCVGIEQSCHGDQMIPENVSSRAALITRRPTTTQHESTRTSSIEVPSVEPMAPLTENQQQQQRNGTVPSSASSSLSYHTAPGVPTPKATLLPPVQQLPGFVRPAEIGRSAQPSLNAAVTPAHGVHQQPVLHFHFQHAGMKGNTDDAALLVHNLTMRSASSASNAGSAVEGAPDSMLVMGGGGGRRGGGASVFPSFSLPGGAATPVTTTTTTTATGLSQRGAPLLLPQSSSSGSGGACGSSLQQSGAQLAAKRKLFPSPSMRTNHHSTSMDAVDGSSQCSRRSPSSGCASALAQNPLQPFSLARHDPLAESMDMIAGALPGGYLALPATLQASVHLMSSAGGGGAGIPFHGDLSDLQSTGDFVMMAAQQQATSSLSIFCQGHASASCDPQVEAAWWGSPRAAPVVGGLLRSHVASRVARSDPRRRQTSFATDLSGLPLVQEASSLWDTDTLTLFDDSATVGGGGGGGAAIGGGGTAARGEKKGWGGGSTGCDSFASGIGGVVGNPLLPINLPRFAEN